MTRKTKFIAGGVVVIVLVLAAVSVSSMSMSNPWLDGEVEDVTRGDLVIPVSANGTIEANKLIEVKSKASGEVAKIHVVEGQIVEAGDVLVELNPVDERRNLERAQAELVRAQAALAQARIKVDDQTRTLPLNTRMAKTRIDDMNAQLRSAEVDWKKTDSLYHRQPPVASEQEWIVRKSTYERLQANLEQAEVEYSRARVTEKTALASAQEDVKLAEAVLDSTSKQVDEAKERLKETRVLAAQRAMVYSVRVREGELVQSGKTSLTGGTPLMYLADTSKMVVVAQVDEADIGSVLKIAPDYARPGHVRRLTDAELQTARAASLSVKATTSRPGVESLIGQRVHVTVEAYRSESFEGVIERILPEPKRLNNVLTFDVRIVLFGEGVQKLLGLQADVEFTADRLHDVLRVKNEAIVSEGRDTYIYVPVDTPRARRKGEKKIAVKIGLTDGIFTEIRSGLTEKDNKVWIKRPRKTDREREEDDKES